MLVHFVNFLNGSIVTVRTLTSKLFFNVGPSLDGFPILFESRITDNVRILPVVLMIDLLGEVEMRLLFVIFCFKWIDWAFLTSCINQFHFVIFSPDFYILFVLIQTLTPWILIVALL